MADSRKADADAITATLTLWHKGQHKGEFFGFVDISPVASRLHAVEAMRGVSARNGEASLSLEDRAALATVIEMEATGERITRTFKSLVTQEGAPGFVQKAGGSAFETGAGVTLSNGLTIAVRDLILSRPDLFSVTSSPTARNDEAQQAIKAHLHAYYRPDAPECQIGAANYSGASIDFTPQAAIAMLMHLRNAMALVGAGGIAAPSGFISQPLA